MFCKYLLYLNAVSTTKEVHSLVIDAVFCHDLGLEALWQALNVKIRFDHMTPYHLVRESLYGHRISGDCELDCKDFIRSYLR